MPFLNDILVIDFETTGNNPHITNPIQVGACLLDKDSLLTKSTFFENVLPLTDEWLAEAEQCHGIARDLNQKTGTKASIVFKRLEESFDFSALTIASWNDFDFQIIQRFIDLRKYRMYKFIELWSYTYPFIIANNIDTKNKQHSLNTLVNHFQLKRNEKHDALQDAELESQVFEKVTAFYNNVMYKS